jgi:hypothetical protein
MAEPSSKEVRSAIKETLQRVIDDLLFYSDEMEMRRLPARDGTSALRMAAGLIALTKELT